MAPIRHLIPSSDAVTVAAFDYGGTGPTLVLTHATGFHGRYWDPVVRRLQPDFRIVSIDLRGHGDSVVPEGFDLHWPGIAQDILAVIDGLELGTGLACAGHSMGGATLMMAELLRPGTFATAWLMEPIIFSRVKHPSDGPSPLVAAARRRREIFASRDDVFERYMSRPPFAGCDPEMVRAYVDHGFRDLPDGTVELKCRGADEAQVFEKSYNDVYDRLAEIQTRVVVAGSGDGERPADFARDTAVGLPNGSFEYYERLTHFAPLEDPQQSADSIRRAISP